MEITPGRFMPVNLATKAAITTNVDEQGEHVVEHIVAANPSQYWRTQPGVTEATLTLKFATKVLVDSLALCLHNLSIAATVKVKLFDNDVLVDEYGKLALIPPYGYGTEPGFGRMGKGGYELAGDDFRHWPNTELWLKQIYDVDEIRIELNDPGSKDGHLRLRYLMVSRSYRPTTTPYRNFQEGYVCGFVPQITSTVRPDGALIVRSETPAREMQAEWRWLTKSELIRMNQILLHVQEKNEPVYWVAFPDDNSQWGRQHAMLAYIVNWTPPQQQSVNGIFSVTMREVMFNVT